MSGSTRTLLIAPGPRGCVTTTRTSRLRRGGISFGFCGGGAGVGGAGGSAAFAIAALSCTYPWSAWYHGNISTRGVATAWRIVGPVSLAPGVPTYSERFTQA